MSDTFGPSLFDSCESADQPSFSESKSPPAMSSGDLIRLVRQCRKCKTEKPYSEFYVNSKGNRPSVCIECVKEKERRRKRQNAAAMSEKYRRWRDLKRGFALVNVAKHRAKKRNMAFDLDPQGIQNRIDAGVCELTGIPFDLTQPRAWNSPSLDRTDSSRGYTQDNVRVVLYSVNVMANTWGHARILEIASAIMDRRREASNGLSERLGKSLQKQLSQYGSMEYSQTWRKKVTPAGRLYWAHTASARPISASDCSGWPTATTNDTRHYSEASLRKFVSDGEVSGHYLDLNAAAQFAGWPTPTAGGGEGGDQSDPEKALERMKGRSNLDDAACLVSGWNTPRATDGSNGGPNQTGGALPADAAMAGWATPSGTVWGGTPERHLERKIAANAAGHAMGLVVSNLDAQAQLAGWATPGATNWKGSAQPGQRRGQLSEQTEQGMVLGPTPSSFPAATANGGASRPVLNPAFSLFLMGFPPAWMECGLRAMKAVSRSRRRSRVASASSEAPGTPSTPTARPHSSARSCKRNPTASDTAP